MNQSNKHCMYAAACFFALNSRALLTKYFKRLKEGKVHGVLPLHHDEGCSNLEGPVYNKNIADEIACESECTEKANCGKSDTPKLYAPPLQ